MSRSLEPARRRGRTLALTPPEPVRPMDLEQADAMVGLSDADARELDTRVETFVDELIELDLHSEDFKARMAAVHALGSKEIREAAGLSNRLLDRPAGQLSGGLIAEGTTVGEALTSLRSTVEALDPSRHGNLFTPKRFLGLIPFGNRLDDYFARYRSSQTSINAIVEGLYRGQDELRRDNAAIEQEKTNLWEAMRRLKQSVHIAKGIDRALSERIARIESSDPEKARVIQEEILFYVRQKITDLLTQETVSAQGYLALDLVRRNNLELIKGVERASTTTVSALRTAVMVAGALGTQRLVLDQVTALGRTTGDILEDTSVGLKRQSAQIQHGAAAATLEMDRLKTAFADIYETIDEMADFKVRAIDSVRRTVDTLSSEVEKARDYLEHARTQETGRLAGAAGTPQS